jgi:hypothetical protein
MKFRIVIHGVESITEAAKLDVENKKGYERNRAVMKFKRRTTG